MRDDRPGESRQFNILWAVVLSILLHVVLVILSIWAPVGIAVSHADEEAQDITFSFAEETADDDPLFPQDAPPAPTEPQPQAVPDFVPQGPELDRVDPAPTFEPAPQVPQLPDERRDPVPPTERPRAERDAPSDPEPREVPPPDPRARSGTPPEGRRAEPSERRLDVDRALQEFRRTNRVPAAPPASQGSGKPRNVFVPDLTQVPQSGFGVGNLVFESRDYDWNDYGRQVYIAIWRAWHNRLWLTTNDFEKWVHRGGGPFLDHQARVRFVIEGNGQVTEISVEGPSGCVPLDDSAADALAEVILPPLPADFPRDREVVHAGFLARGEVRAMRPVLQRYRAMGLFGPAAAPPDR